MKVLLNEIVIKFGEYDEQLGKMTTICDKMQEVNMCYYYEKDGV